MGAYINPKGESKEEFLKREGKPISKEDAIKHKDFKKNLVVALLHNPSFTAAAIAFDERELEAVTYSQDKRPIDYFVVPRKKLYDVSGLQSYLPPGK